MAVIGAYDRSKFLAELNEPVNTGSGWITPATAKAQARANLEVAGATALSGIVALTDSSGGSAGDTIGTIGATYSQTEVADAIASLAAKVNAILAALS